MQSLTNLNAHAQLSRKKVMCMGFLFKKIWHPFLLMGNRKFSTLTSRYLITNYKEIQCS